MRLVPVGGHDHELGYSVVFPACEEFVDGPMERLAPKTGGAWPGTSAHRHAVGEDRRPEDATAFGDLGGNGFGHADVRTERKVRSVLFQGSDGHDEAGIPRQGAPHSNPAQLVKRV